MNDRLQIGMNVPVTEPNWNIIFNIPSSVSYNTFKCMRNYDPYLDDTEQ